MYTLFVKSKNYGWRMLGQSSLDSLLKVFRDIYKFSDVPVKITDRNNRVIYSRI